jgi:hypothetical protein
LENHALFHLIDEEENKTTLTLEEAKAFYQQIEKMHGYVGFFESDY